jgi:FlaA1/EpsC-like NDP-sugar epimerase
MKQKISHSRNINTIIVGAGKAGLLLVEDILDRTDSSINVVGLVDDDPKKYKKNIRDKIVLGKISDLAEIVNKYKIEELIIALPSQRGSMIRKIVESTGQLGLIYKILPRLPEVLRQDFEKDYLKFVRKVIAEDLLGGEILKSDQDEIGDFVQHKTIMITGAAGSIGSELSKQVISYGASEVVLYDWWEFGMFDLKNHIESNYPNVKVHYYIGDIKDKNRVDSVMKQHNPDTVFHAAAYKHVPLMEENGTEAINNNVFGTKIVGSLAIKNKVKKFILVSTDKAVNPTNIMGATKRAAEMVINDISQNNNHTTFCSVRFGNVINSMGSAIPVFQKQIENGGPLTVTHKDITRYFMTIPEAVHLILKTWVMGENNDLFVLDMGEPIKIYDLAKLLICINGYVPNEDIKINIVGLRPGEKLYEEVLIEQEEVNSTVFDKIYKTKNYHNFDRVLFNKNLKDTAKLLSSGILARKDVQKTMEKLVSTYNVID